jgi:hypothetical protein
VQTRAQVNSFLSAASTALVYSRVITAGLLSVLNFCRRFAHLVGIIDSGEATTEVISHTKGLEALERALLYVEQHSKTTPTDVIFMKRWRDTAASFRRSTLYQKKITDVIKKDNL